MKPIYIAFGANLSNPKLTFTGAMSALQNRGVTIVKMSGLWQSPAWPSGGDQPDYINACAQVDYGGSARQFLDLLHKVEIEFGRERSIKNAARTLDLDLLDYQGEILTEKGGMIIPHPRMLSRSFVLFPLSDIAPDWRDPLHKVQLWDWIARLPLADVESLKKLSHQLKSGRE